MIYILFPGKSSVIFGKGVFKKFYHRMFFIGRVKNGNNIKAQIYSF